MSTKTWLVVLLLITVFTGGRIIPFLISVVIVGGSFCYVVEKVTGVDLISKIMRRGG